MAIKTNPNCPCPNTTCEVHGNCKECAKDHKGKGMYCKLPKWRKKLNNFICKFLPK
jgi:hypothetical protein